MDLSDILNGVVPSLGTLGGNGLPTPNVSVPSVGGGWGGGSDSGASAFSKILPSLVGAGTGILGSYLKTKQEQGPQYANLAERQKEFQTQQANRAAEIQRRNQLFGMAAPGILSNLGYSADSIPNILGKLTANG